MLLYSYCILAETFKNIFMAWFKANAVQLYFICNYVICTQFCMRMHICTYRYGFTEILRHKLNNT
jgi:hypothetical protein